RGRSVQDVREGGQGEDGGGEERQRRDRSRAGRLEPLDAVSEPSGEKGKPEHQQAVGEDRTDQRRFDDTDKPLVECEQRNEQLGQVAERRLNRARASRAEPPSELL